MLLTDIPAPGFRSMYQCSPIAGYAVSVYDPDNLNFMQDWNKITSFFKKL
jgi:hypothetical protein